MTLFTRHPAATEPVPLSPIAEGAASGIDDVPAPPPAPSQAEDATAVVILVCTSCRAPDGADTRPTDGERLLAAVRALQGDVEPGAEAEAGCEAGTGAAPFFLPDEQIALDQPKLLRPGSGQPPSRSSGAMRTSATPAGAAGKALGAAEGKATGEARVEGTACLANCNRRLSAALVARNGWTYAFGNLTPADAAGLLEGARMLGEAGGAPLPWRGRPDCLKRGLIARIPPLSGDGR